MNTLKMALMAGLAWSQLLGAAWAAAPLGDWLVNGHNPGDERPYKGHVSVIKSGETYTVMWRFGSTTYVGTGIEQGNSFAVTFKPSQGQMVGIALFVKQGEQWSGRWSTMGGQAVGQEIWSKSGRPTGDK